MKSKLIDLNLKLDARASAWKTYNDLNLVYLTPKKSVFRYKYTILDEDKDNLFFTRETDYPQVDKNGKYFTVPEPDLIDFSLGSANKFINNNSVIEINNIIYRPYKIQTRYDLKRFYIGFEPI